MPRTGALSHLVTSCGVVLTFLIAVAGCGPRQSARIGIDNAIEGAWHVVETAVRTPGGEWQVQPVPQGGLYVFSARHYSYFYVRGADPRPRFVDANGATQAEKATAFDNFIAGAGSYSFDGTTLLLRADFRKNPNEMNGEVWRMAAELRGGTLQLLFANPPFLPNRDWRTTLARAR